MPPPSLTPVVNYTLCPFCGYSCDRSINLDDDSAPEEGDLSMCFECGEFSVFVMIPGGLRKPTEAEYTAIGLSPQIQEVRRAWVAAKRGMS